MAGFDSIIVLLGLLVIPALYLIYNQMIKKRRKAAIKFSNLMFVKSAISNKKKSKRDMWIFMISLAIIALMIIGYCKETLTYSFFKRAKICCSCCTIFKYYNPCMIFFI